MAIYSETRQLFKIEAAAPFGVLNSKLWMRGSNSYRLFVQSEPENKPAVWVLGWSWAASTAALSLLLFGGFLLSLFISLNKSVKGSVDFSVYAVVEKLEIH